jgi:hypothetical protein
MPNFQGQGIMKSYTSSYWLCFSDVEVKKNTCFYSLWQCEFN